MLIFFGVFLLFIGACEEDDSVDVVTLSNLEVNTEISSDVPGEVIFRSTAAGAETFNYDFGDGTSEESVTGYVVKTYTEVGQSNYTVTVTATGKDGSTLTESVQVSVDIPAANPELVNTLTGESSKTWFLAVAQPGHLGVGPAREGIDGEWWFPKWYSAQAFEKCGADISDCFCDDELTFTLNDNGEVSYVLDNKGQTFFNIGHLSAAGGSGDEDACYDFDVSGNKAVTISPVTGNVPDGETTGFQLEFSDEGFMSYYVGSSTYEILSISDDLLH